MIPSCVIGTCDAFRWSVGRSVGWSMKVLSAIRHKLYTLCSHIRHTLVLESMLQEDAAEYSTTTKMYLEFFRVGRKFGCHAYSNMALCILEIRCQNPVNEYYCHFPFGIRRRRYSNELLHLTYTTRPNSPDLVRDVRARCTCIGSVSRCRDTKLSFYSLMKKTWLFKHS